MSTPEIETEIAAKNEISYIDTIKNMMTTLTEQMAVNKTFMNSLRSVLKESEKVSKELEKLRNKRGKTKTVRSPDALPSGITKPVAISDELAKFLGVAPGTLVPRNEVTKGVSGFVKSNELSDPSNKQKFILDDRPAAKALKVLLGNPKEDVTYFNLQRYLKHHYLPMQATVPEVTITKKVVEPVAASSEAPVLKKKVLVKKKPVSSTELTEEA
jgi:chromatin remodeling complex protein RSC6